MVWNIAWCMGGISGVCVCVCVCAGRDVVCGGIIVWCMMCFVGYGMGEMGRCEGGEGRYRDGGGGGGGGERRAKNGIVWDKGVAERKRAQGVTGLDGTSNPSRFGKVVIVGGEGRD